jgi:hypothetical protein
VRHAVYREPAFAAARRLIDELDQATIAKLALRSNARVCEHCGMQRFVIVLGIFGAACGGSKPVAVDAPVPVEPTVEVVAAPATISPGDMVTFTVTVKSYKIVSPLAGPPAKDGEGHYHYYLDDDANYTAGWTPTVRFKSLATTTPGPHTMRFALATNVHETRLPVVEATATFTVQ